MARTSSYKLDGKYTFSPQTVQRISTLVDEIASFKTYQDFFDSVSMPEVQEYKIDDQHGVTVVDIPPRKKGKSGKGAAFVVHLPMGNPLDHNQKYQLAVIATLFPTKRIIGFGNPGGGKYSYAFQDLTRSERFGIATGFKTEPLVATELAYLESNRITSVVHIGFSYGSFKALIESCFAPAGSVKRIVAIELLSHRRAPWRLMRDFKKTLAPLGEYVDRTKLKTFKAARHEAGKGNDYNAGLRRSISLSIGLLLSFRSGPALLKKALARQPDATVSVIWGTESELVNDKKITAAIQKLDHEFHGRLRTMRLPGDKHGLANDVFLHAAILHEALAGV